MTEQYWDKLFEQEEYRQFSRMLDDLTQSYKLYWLEAIVKLSTSNSVLSFEDVINEMIYNAWYTVSSYHLHLGPYIDKKPNSKLEEAVIEIENRMGTQVNDSPEKIKKDISASSPKLTDIKNQLARNVPYRLLSPFLGLSGNDALWNSQSRIIDYIDHAENALYSIENGTGLNKKIIINPAWLNFINSNSSIILGWIECEKIKYVQARNPGVPCISSKLEPPLQKRNLESVRKLWSYVSNNVSLRDIYTSESLDITEADIDHFIPWSYVCSDELWNLMPVKNSINRSKSNSLPDWDKYFNPFADNQYKMYSLVLDDDNAKMLFDNCRENNLYSIWASELLYTGNRDRDQFYKILNENVWPVYNSARIQGYKVWNMD